MHNERVAIVLQLQSPQAFGQLTQELLAALQRNNDPDTLLPTVAHLERIASFDPLAGIYFIVLNVSIIDNSKRTRGHPPNFLDPP